MIDYDATLQRFFDECVKYLDKLLVKAKDKENADKIKYAISVVRQVAANPEKYADYIARCDAGLERDVGSGFVPDHHRDNSVYVAYNDVLAIMGDLHDSFDFQRKQAQQKLLKSLQTVKYKNSVSLVERFGEMLKGAEFFAVKTKAENMK